MNVKKNPEIIGPIAMVIPTISRNKSVNTHFRTIFNEHF